MKKISFLHVFIILLLLSIMGCTAPHGPKLDNYPNSKWVSQEPYGVFYITDSLCTPLSLTINGETETYMLDMNDEIASRALILKWNEDPYYEYTSEDMLVSTGASYYSNKLVLKVINDPTGLLDGYKKVTFYRDFEYEKNFQEQVKEPTPTDIPLPDITRPLTEDEKLLSDEMKALFIELLGCDEPQASYNADLLIRLNIKEIVELTVIHRDEWGGATVSITDETGETYCLTLDMDGGIVMVRKGDIDGGIIYYIDYYDEHFE